MDDIEYVRPDPWTDGETQSPNSAALSSTHFLSDDFCVIRDEQFFLRCVLEVQRADSKEPLGIGVWCLVSRRDYETYRDQFDFGQSPRVIFARLANEVPHFAETFNRKCKLHVQGERKRPLVELV